MSAALRVRAQLDMTAAFRKSLQEPDEQMQLELFDGAIASLMPPTLGLFL